jgi:acyl-CoA synthetase (AMP-forming)/AMP-acid ligase II
MNLNDFIRYNVAQYPQKVATIFRDVRRTHQEFGTRVNKLSNALLSLDVYKGDRIAILALNRPEYMEVYWGAWGIGGVVVPLNSRFVGPEAAFVINNSGANTVIVQAELIKTIDSVRNELRGVKNFICIGDNGEGYLNYEELISAGASAETGIPVTEDDLAFIGYTSGTTGRPKGAMITQKNIISMVSYQLADLPRKPEDVGMVLFPFFHIGVTPAFAQIVRPMTCVFSDYEPNNVARLVEQEKITNLAITATQLRMFVNHPDVQKYDLSSIKSIVTGGGFTSPQTARKLFELIPQVVLDSVYGMTENTAHLCSKMIYRETLAAEEERMSALAARAGVRPSGLTAGKPMYGVQARLVDDKDNEVGVNKIGEVACYGNTVMKGYWRLPQESADALRGGWFHTGDLGIRTEDGEYFVVDRKKDMILSGDENIFPAEVEEVIATHPDVVEVAVIGVPDEKWGEAAKAIVVLREGSKVTEEEIRQHCQDKIARYKIPKSVAFVAQLPRNPAGKVIKGILREKHIES